MLKEKIGLVRSIEVEAQGCVSAMELFCSALQRFTNTKDNAQVYGSWLQVLSQLEFHGTTTDSIHCSYLYIQFARPPHLDGISFLNAFHI